MVQKLSDYSVSEDVLHLRAAADRILDAIIGVYEQAGVPLPTRRYRMAGRPAEDCEQLVLSFMQMYLGAPGDQANEPQRCSAPRSAVFNITVSREFPMSASKTSAAPPTPEQIEWSSDWALVDSNLLFDSLAEFDQWEPGMPGPGVIATVNAADPSGGIQTTTMNLTLVIP